MKTELEAERLIFTLPYKSGKPGEVRTQEELAKDQRLLEFLMQRYALRIEGYQEYVRQMLDNGTDKCK